VAGQCQPANGFDGQVSAREQPLERQGRLSGYEAAAGAGAPPVVDDPSAAGRSRDSGCSVRLYAIVARPLRSCDHRMSGTDITGFAGGQ